MKALYYITMALMILIGVPFAVLALLCKGVGKLSEWIFNGFGWIADRAEWKLRQEEYADEKAKEARMNVLRSCKPAQEEAADVEFE